MFSSISCSSTLTSRQSWHSQFLSSPTCFPPPGENPLLFCSFRRAPCIHFHSNLSETDEMDTGRGLMFHNLQFLRPSFVKCPASCTVHICVFLSAAKLAIFLQGPGLQPTSHSSESTQVALFPSDHRDRRMTLNCWTLFLNYCAIMEKVCLVICSSHKLTFSMLDGPCISFSTPRF